MRLTGLRRYPVKGLRGEDHAALDVDAWGPSGDRRWMVVQPDGGFMSQRRWPGLARIGATLQGDGSLLLQSREASIRVPRPDGAARLRVTVWLRELDAALAGAAADAWLAARLGQACRLVYLDDPSARPVERIPGVREDDTVSFADAYPILLTSTASLSALNAELEAPVGMDRFRPNLVIDGAAPWQEDGWQRLRIGGMVFRAPKACTRCIVTTLDQATGLAPVPGEPLRTLGRLNRNAAGIVFGRNLIPDAPGRLQVGDPVEVLSET
ncbi:MOSC domain-containing protein [Lichenicoccus sp.]|uniref:MOSC domain-containing protein n=1 Tax=Lichenicoccus sp. TaxID=2781899 RepID=UPI003D1521D7